MNTQPLEDETYKVVMNDEEQYSLLPITSSNPPGWRDAGWIGRRDECLARIGEVWTDMRPRSLRDRHTPSTETAREVSRV